MRIANLKLNIIFREGHVEGRDIIMSVKLSLHMSNYSVGELNGLIMFNMITKSSLLVKMIEVQTHGDDMMLINGVNEVR